MSKETPDHHDMELTLRLYDMRREAITRQSREALNFKFWPKSYDDVKAVSNDFKHELNAPWRQMSGYWEMVYGFARHGLCNADFLAENNGEGMFLFAKLQPFIEQIRKDSSPTAFQNVEWITKNCEQGRKRFEMITGRVKAMMAKM